LKAYGFANARKTIEQGWNNVLPGTASQRLEVMHHRRNLLVAAYRGMKEDDVADFVQQAPISIVSRVLVEHVSYPRTKLLTAEEYSHKPWTVEGWTNNLTEGTFTFRWCGYSICPVFSQSPRWPEYYRLFGPRALSPPTPIPPPSGALLDMIDSDGFRLGL
jgi:hypothetical protein